MVSTYNILYTWVFVGGGRWGGVAFKQLPFNFKALTLSLSVQQSSTDTIFYNTLGRSLHLLLALDLLMWLTDSGEKKQWNMLH